MVEMKEGNARTPINSVVEEYDKNINLKDSQTLREEYIEALLKYLEKSERGEKEKNICFNKVKNLEMTLRDTGITEDDITNMQSNILFIYYIDKGLNNTRKRKQYKHRKQ